MKYYLCCVLIMALFASNFSVHQNSPKNLKEALKGKWVYKFSLIDNQKRALETNKRCPTHIMEFKKCNDSLDINHFPVTVRKMRAENVLINLNEKDYDTLGNLIDTYYPVARTITDSINHVSKYGNKSKDEYFIQTITSDTLVIFNNKYYYLDSKAYSQIKHFYVKIKP